MPDQFANLLMPIQINKMRLQNRMVAAPMTGMVATADGYVTDRLIESYRLRAWGGYGLIIAEVSTPQDGAVIGGLQLSAANETYLPGLAELAEVIHEGGSKAALQIGHGGGVTNPAWSNGHVPVTPSGITFRRIRPGEPQVRELSAIEVEETLDAFAEASDRAKRAGYDAIEFHMAHGTLPHQFLTPVLNRRTDRWGEPSAFPVEQIRRARQAVGPDFPILVRISADDFRKDSGADLEHMLKIAPLLEAAGADALDVSGGNASNRYDGWVILSMYYPRASLVHLAEAVKKVVSVPVIAVGRLNDPRLCEHIIAKGKADMVALGRVSLADPEFPKKVAEGRPDDIRRCTGCDLCTRGSYYGLAVKCSVNYDFARMPWEYEVRRAEQPKKVMVVGGGVSGMEAARVAFQRKHDVTLYEKDEMLGGAVLSMASAIPRLNTRDLRNAVIWQKHELAKLGVRVELNTAVTADLVAREQPDVVVLATGSLPTVPSIVGLESANVCTVDDYLKGRVAVGDEVVILGSAYGLEIAVSLDRDGKKVTLVEEGDRVGENPYIYPRLVVLKRFLKETRVEVLLNTKTKEVTPQAVIVVDKHGLERSLRADTVILAQGRSPSSELAGALRGKGHELYEIGDCWRTGNIMDAIHSGARVARRL